MELGRPCSESTFTDEEPPPAAAVTLPVAVAFLFSVDELGVVAVDVDDDDALPDPERVLRGGLRDLVGVEDDADDGEVVVDWGALCGDISFRQ